MVIENKYHLKGNSQVWEYQGNCAYTGVPEYCHHGKTEKHHPVHWFPEAILPLCEVHHSLILGRKKKTDKEYHVNKTLDDMRTEIHQLEIEMLSHFNLREADIDKH
jgi:hypothetical protein